MGTIKTTNIETITGSGTLTIGQSGETITFPAGVTVTNNGTQTGFGGVNTPAFLAGATVNQSVSNATQTLVQYNSEILDTNNCYNNSTYLFTPNVAGKYFIFASIKFQTATDFNYFEIAIRKNNSSTVAFSNMSNQYYDHLKCFSIVDMNGSTDYLGAYTYQELGSSVSTDTGGASYILQFGAYKIIT